MQSECYEFANETKWFNGFLLCVECVCLQRTSDEKFWERGTKKDDGEYIMWVSERCTQLSTSDPDLEGVIVMAEHQYSTTSHLYDDAWISSSRGFVRSFNIFYCSFCLTCVVLHEYSSDCVLDLYWPVSTSGLYKIYWDFKFVYKPPLKRK